MNLHDWIDEVCDTLDIDVEVDESLVLDVAKDAADAVVRPAAPITTFLLGYAAARGDGDPEEVERLAGLIADLAARWDQPATGSEDVGGSGGSGDPGGDEEADDPLDDGGEDEDDGEESA